MSSCLAFPSVYRDWDEKRANELNDDGGRSEYLCRWRRLRGERMAVAGWSLGTNVALVVPALYACAAGLARYNQVRSIKTE